MPNTPLTWTGLVLSCFIATAAARDKVIHVSPTGRDDNPGTKAKPLATCAAAQRAARKALADAPKANVTVELAGGTYFLPAPLTLGPADGGSADRAVLWRAARGAKPILSGGRRITGWKPGKGKLWTVTLKDARAGTWHFRQLFVNGRRGTRARTPNIDADEYCFRLTGATISRDLKTHTLTVGPGKVKAWAGLADAEVIVLKNWATLHKKIAAVDPATGLVTLRPPHVKYFGGNRPRKGGGCFFENSIDFLDSPGEWYLDRATGVLNYWPPKGQDMATVEVIAPVLTHVLAVAGTGKKPVRNLHLRGLSFMHTHFPLPTEGHHGRQAAYRYGGGAMPRSVRWTYVTGGSVIGCTVAHVGGSGLGLLDGCANCRVEGCRVFDCEGNGIDLGGANDPKLAPKDCRLANNHVYRCGAAYYGAVGIRIGFAQRIVLEHNLVRDLPYTGISIGWRWNPTPTVAREFVLRHNHVYDVMKLVCDGGAIYSLGFIPGTVIRANHLHDVHRSKYAVAAPNNGIFLDEGSKGFLVEGNVIYNTAGKPIRHNRNKSEWHTWKDNVLLQGPATAEQRKGVKQAGLEPEYLKPLPGE